jgi:hypothetical protein
MCKKLVTRPEDAGRRKTEDRKREEEWDLGTRKTWSTGSGRAVGKMAVAFTVPRDCCLEA